MVGFKDQKSALAVKTEIWRMLNMLVMIIRTWLMRLLSLHQLQLCLQYNLHRIWWILLFWRLFTHTILPFAENTLLLFAHITMYIVFFIRSSTSLPPCFALYVVLILCNYCYGVIDLWVLLLKGKKWYLNHYNDVIMGAIASQITSLTIVYPTVYSGADQRKHQSSASLAFVHKWPETRKIVTFDDVIMVHYAVQYADCSVISMSFIDATSFLSEPTSSQS